MFNLSNFIEDVSAVVGRWTGSAGLSKKKESAYWGAFVILILVFAMLLMGNWTWWLGAPAFIIFLVLMLMMYQEPKQKRDDTGKSS